MRLHFHPFLILLIAATTWWDVVGPSSSRRNETAVNDAYILMPDERSAFLYYYSLELETSKTTREALESLLAAFVRQ